MNKFPRADAFRSIRIAPLKCKAVAGVVYVGELCLDQVALVGPDAATAYRAAVNYFGPQFKEEGAEEVVILRKDHFAKLLKLAGVESAEAA